MEKAGESRIEKGGDNVPKDLRGVAPAAKKSKVGPVKPKALCRIPQARPNAIKPIFADAFVTAAA